LHLTARGAQSFPPARIDALLKPLDRFRLPLIAVSGGPDSTALLLMAADWAERRARRIAAATVDHGLRAESAAEAQAAAKLCDKLGVAHKTLVWTGPKPSTRIQERAREARYRLLAAHARAIRADAIVTAHQADDQAATVLLRLLRGSGVAGLRSMVAMSARDGIALVRPLLGVPKADLVAFCRANDLPFVDDPSNADARYARAALGPLLAQLAEHGLDRDALLRLARRAGEADEAIARAAAEFEARLAGDGPIGARALFAAPLAVVQRVLAHRLARAGGRDASRIGLEKIEALARAIVDALAEGRAFRANAGGAIASLSADGELEFAPEPPRRGASARSGPGKG
jgi:tRNA(Ile)-lysidine synthase